MKKNETNNIKTSRVTWSHQQCRYEHGPVFGGRWNFEASRGICHFCRIFMFLRNYVEFGTDRWLGDKHGIFWSGLSGRRQLINVCGHDFAMK